MTQQKKLGGTFSFPGTPFQVFRVGYGAMQLSGPGIFGPPKDRTEAVRVLHAAMEAGVNHIDTSDFYGPYVTNQIVREALYPYPAGLVIVTKLGGRRDEKGGWLAAHSGQELIEGAESNLRNLRLDVLDIVNLRAWGIHGPDPGFDVRPSMDVLADLQRRGIIRHIGVSNVTREQLVAAQKIAPVVCVQNCYNIANRADDRLIDDLAQQGIPYVPFFPLGGFTPLQSGHLNATAASLGATPMQVALAWLLHRSSNMLLIPGTSSVAHLRENLAAASLELSSEALQRLDAIAREASHS
ncbi:oxidoreductase [Edaphobacter sp.]|uniref:oxidoreductase n=1 Tax=Edaphobacter sp. TaxID=1934404 RepID=UPI002DB95543|nr:oxidoreductase [Edaphobacter sp.]HEU5340587.1 oxidoreductase [Edaphobacter sp.]